MPTKSFVSPGMQAPYAADVSNLAQEQAQLDSLVELKRGIA